MWIVALILGLIFLAGVILLARENPTTVSVNLPGGYAWVDAPFALVVAASGLIGVFFGFLIGLWGILRRSLALRRLRGQLESQQRAVTALEAQVATLERLSPPRGTPDYTTAERRTTSDEP